MNHGSQFKVDASRLVSRDRLTVYSPPERKITVDAFFRAGGDSIESQLLRMLVVLVVVQIILQIISLNKKPQD